MSEAEALKVMSAERLAEIKRQLLAPYGGAADELDTVEEATIYELALEVERMREREAALIHLANVALDNHKRRMDEALAFVRFVAEVPLHQAYVGRLLRINDQANELLARDK